MLESFPIPSPFPGRINCCYFQSLSERRRGVNQYLVALNLRWPMKARKTNSRIRIKLSRSRNCAVRSRSPITTRRKYRSSQSLKKSASNINIKKLSTVLDLLSSAISSLTNTTSALKSTVAAMHRRVDTIEKGIRGYSSIIPLKLEEFPTISPLTKKPVKFT